MAHQIAGHVQPELDKSEHASIGGVEGKKVFVIDDSGNQILDFGSKAYATQVAEDSGDSNVTYVGKADPGTATSAASWQIQKIDETSGAVIQFADGDSSYNNVWDDRESLSYS